MRFFFRLTRVLCTFLGAWLLLVSFTPLVSWMTRDMAVDWFDGDGDVLIVLGGSMLVDGTGPQATLGYDSYLRCTYASWILARHHYQYVVLSGSNGLAQSMARFLAARGVAPQQLLTERSAQTTEQNAEFVRNILAHQTDLGPHPTLVILTSDYHTRRARRVFEHFGLRVRVIPVPDLAKQINFPEQRWSAFLGISGEFVKTIFYRLSGKI